MGGSGWVQPKLCVHMVIERGARLLRISILHDLVFQNLQNCSSIVYAGSTV